MALPSDADVIAVRGYWWDEATGAGVRAANGTPATIVFEPVPTLGVKASGTPNVRDVTSTGHIKTRRRTATVDPVTGYFCTLLLASNDPDLDAYGGRRVTFPGEQSFLIEVPYNASPVTVDSAMSAAIGRPVGTSIKAIWLTEASLLESPTPSNPAAYMTAQQVLAAIGVGVSGGVDAHNTSTSAHTDLRMMIAGNAVTASDALVTHVIDPTPHPEYDDLPSLTLLFKNGLV